MLLPRLRQKRSVLRSRSQEEPCSSCTRVGRRSLAVEQPRLRQKDCCSAFMPEGGRALQHLHSHAALMSTAGGQTQTARQISGRVFGLSKGAGLATHSMAAALPGAAWVSLTCSKRARRWLPVHEGRGGLTVVPQNVHASALLRHTVWRLHCVCTDVPLPTL